MAYMCMSCYEIYHLKLLEQDFYKEHFEYKCPKMNCCGRVVEIDDMLLPIIKVLNKKGYVTEFCCSSHSYENGYANTYISFDEDYMPDILPKGFDLEDDEYYKKNYPPNNKPSGSMCIRKTYSKNLSELELHNAICQTMIDLSIWVENLEDIY